MFFTQCALIGTIVYTRHTLETARPVQKLIKEATSSSIPFTGETFRLLYSQLHAHNRVAYLVIYASKTLFGGVLFSGLLTNIPM